ncbi:class I SAM-dependent methyltransferase [Ornithinimicrobium cavernae]|uniref:class I SAM-dependent methyltransferase n=1 Tax=Ornithinimicrobium cavernae TaxID=2666047 RepID=UPI000D68EACB|nr:class I SAM-dependent methyltransferase [Ornithinimicrobium cavernae]
MVPGEGAQRQHWKRRPIFINLLSLFPPGKLVDLGTGHGGFAVHAADLGWEVTAVDARSERWPKDDRVTWVKQDVREHDLSGYDLICCLGLFYHLTLPDQLDLLRRAAGRPMIIDTHLDHGSHKHPLSERVVEGDGYEGRYYREPGVLTSSWGNKHSFWPTLESFERMLLETGHGPLLPVQPWVTDDRTFFLVLPPLVDSSRRPEWASRLPDATSSPEPRALRVPQHAGAAARGAARDAARRARRIAGGVRRRMRQR